MSYVLQKIRAGMNADELYNVLLRIYKWKHLGLRHNLPRLHTISPKIAKIDISRKRCKYTNGFTCEDRKVLLSHQPCCQYCGRKRYLTVDRVNPNFGYLKDNVQILCFLCNRMKSNLHQHIFLSFVRFYVTH